MPQATQVWALTEGLLALLLLLIFLELLTWPRPWPWFNLHSSGCIGHRHSDLFWAATSASSQMIPILSKLTVLLQFACGRSGSLLNPGISRCNACRELLTEMKNWKQLITDSNEDRWDHLERQSQKWRQLKEDRFIFVEIRTNCWDGWDASWEWTTPE